MDENLIKSKRLDNLKQSVKYEFYGILTQKIRTKLKTIFRSKKNLTFLFNFSKIIQHQENLSIILHFEENQFEANFLSKEIARLARLTSLTLYLRSNNIGESGADSLSTALTALTGLTSLTLDLNENNIGDSGASSLSNAFTKLIDLTSFTLILNNNNILFYNGRKSY